MTRVKICGLRDLPNALVAADAGADMLGFVFAPSRRRVSPEDVAPIIGALRRRADVQTVGIFVNETPEEMNRVAELCDLDVIQLSGDEGGDVVAQLQRPAFKTLHIRPDTAPSDIEEQVRQVRADVVHLDAGAAGVYGGTGETFDWSLVPGAARSILLSGGLTPLNVGEAIRVVRPWGVDVSSGVETNGAKDPAKIRAFIRAARVAG